MSSTPAAPPEASPRRVRHQAGEALALMAFSAVLSLAMAVALVLISSLGRG